MFTPYLGKWFIILTDVFHTAWNDQHISHWKPMLHLLWRSTTSLPSLAMPWADFVVGHRKSNGRSVWTQWICGYLGGRLTFGGLDGFKSDIYFIQSIMYQLSIDAMMIVFILYVCMYLYLYRSSCMIYINMLFWCFQVGCKLGGWPSSLLGNMALRLILVELIWEMPAGGWEGSSGTHQ